MKRKILIPIDEANQLTAEAQKRAEADIEELRKLGITIDEVRTLLSEWAGRNLGLYDLRSKVQYALATGIPAGQTQGHVSHTELALFRAEVKMSNAVPEDVL